MKGCRYRFVDVVAHVRELNGTHVTDLHQIYPTNLLAIDDMLLRRIWTVIISKNFILTRPIVEQLKNNPKIVNITV